MGNTDNHNSEEYEDDRITRSRLARGDVNKIISLARENHYLDFSSFLQMLRDDHQIYISKDTLSRLKNKYNLYFKTSEVKKTNSIDYIKKNRTFIRIKPVKTKSSNNKKNKKGKNKRPRRLGDVTKLERYGEYNLKDLKKLVFHEYLNGKSFEEISEENGIPYRVLHYFFIDCKNKRGFNLIQELGKRIAYENKEMFVKVSNLINTNFKNDLVLDRTNRVIVNKVQAELLKMINTKEVLQSDLIFVSEFMKRLKDVNLYQYTETVFGLMDRFGINVKNDGEKQTVSSSKVVNVNDYVSYVINDDVNNLVNLEDEPEDSDEHEGSSEDKKDEKVNLDEK